MKKVKQEVMRRYHPDKHFNVVNESFGAGNGDQYDKEKTLQDMINDVCRVAFKVFETSQTYV